MRVAFLIALLLGISAAHADRIPRVGIFSGFPRAKLPNGGYMPTEVPFPAVADLSTLRVTLERGQCFGSCPIYKVEIRGDGSVLFKGEGFVAISGHHRATISRATIERLVDAFREARFFSLLNNYSAAITDGSAIQISISFDGQKKVVGDYFGIEAGMPEKVRALEELVDTAAGTDRWIKGSLRSIAELKAEGWDFAGQDDEHQKMIMNAAETASSGLFNAVLDAGAKPNGFFGCGAAFEAAEHSDVRALKKLMRLKVPTNWDPPAGDKGYEDWSCNVLFAGLDSSDPEVLRTILAQRPDVNRVDEIGDTPLIYLVGRARAGRGKADRDVIARVELLLSFGADPYVRDAKGRTALDVAVAEKSPTVPVLKRWMEAHPQSR
jgi:Domain of unknown function (DUF6438)